MSIMHIENSLGRNRGFSLVEVMIGLVMGMIVLLIIMQAFSVAEGYKRTTTTGSDAQVNGLLALRTLESEVRVAGYGLMNTTSLCPSINTVDPVIKTPPTVMSVSNMPVRIVDGGTGSDTIEVMYSSSATGAAPARISKAMPSPSNATFVHNTLGFAACDFVLLASKDGSKACTLEQATKIDGHPTPKILTSHGHSNYNAPGGLNHYPTGGYSTSDIVINMGSFVHRRFSVFKNGTNDEFYLRQTKINAADDGCNPVEANPNLDLISNIVNIQAQYGIAATAGSQEVNCWTDAKSTSTGCGITSGGNWSAPSFTDAKKIKAVRLAIVARSALSEKPSGSGSICDATGAAPTSWDKGPVINLSNISNWQCYRYKVYQTVIPMINVIWSNS
jgi:type IV pilus assembly protein PilW